MIRIDDCDLSKMKKKIFKNVYNFWMMKLSTGVGGSTYAATGKIGGCEYDSGFKAFGGYSKKEIARLLKKELLKLANS